MLKRKIAALKIAVILSKKERFQVCTGWFTYRLSYKMRYNDAHRLGEGGLSLLTPIASCLCPDVAHVWKWAVWTIHPSLAVLVSSPKENRRVKTKKVRNIHKSFLFLLKCNFCWWFTKSKSFENEKLAWSLEIYRFTKIFNSSTNSILPIRR